MSLAAPTPSPRLAFPPVPLSDPSGILSDAINLDNYLKALFAYANTFGRPLGRLTRYFASALPSSIAEENVTRAAAEIAANHAARIAAEQAYDDANIVAIAADPAYVPPAFIFVAPPFVYVPANPIPRPRSDPGFLEAIDTDDYYNANAAARKVIREDYAFEEAINKTATAAYNEDRDALDHMYHYLESTLSRTTRDAIAPFEHFRQTPIPDIIRILSENNSSVPPEDIIAVINAIQQPYDPKIPARTWYHTFKTQATILTQYEAHPGATTIVQWFLTALRDSRIGSRLAPGIDHYNRTHPNVSKDAIAVPEAQRRSLDTAMAAMLIEINNLSTYPDTHNPWTAAAAVQIDPTAPAARPQQRRPNPKPPQTPSPTATATDQRRYCFSCGSQYDHGSRYCPPHLRKPGHDETARYTNAMRPVPGYAGAPYTKLPLTKP